MPEQIHPLLTPSPQLSSSRQAELQQLFLDLRGNIEEREALLPLVVQELKVISADELYSMRHTFGTWYALLCFPDIVSLQHTDVETVFASLSMLAFFHDIDVWKTLVRYLQLRTVDEADMGEVYGRIRNSFIHSPQYICVLNGSPVSFASFFEQVSLYEQKNDSLALSSYYGGIGKAILADSASSLTEEDVKTIMFRLQDMVHFLQGVSKENIFVIVDSHFYPQKYTALAQTVEQATPVSSLPALDDAPRETETLLSSPSTVVEPEASAQSASQSLVPPVIDESFLEELKAHTQDLAVWLGDDAVLALLLSFLQGYPTVQQARHTLAEALMSLFPSFSYPKDEAVVHTILGLDEFLKEHEYGGEHDFLYFDDTDGTFHWHESYVS